MKNRNIPYYAAALLMAAGLSTSMVSCVDTDEPESIAQLRNAKAEEVRARANEINQEAEVQKSLAALNNAELARKAAETEAYTAMQVLNRKNQELLNAKQELANAKEQIEIDKTKLQNALQAAKDSIALDSLKAAYEWTIKVAKANAEAKYEAAATALTKAKNDATIALATEKNRVDEAQKAALIAAARFKQYGINDTLIALNNAYQDSLDILTDKQRALTKAINDLDKKYTDEDAYEADIEAKQKAYDDAVEAQAKFKDLAQSTEVKTWLDTWATLDEAINNATPKKEQIGYEITKLKQDSTALADAFPIKPSDYQDQEVKKDDIKFDIPELIQAKLKAKATFGDFTVSDDGATLSNSKDLKNSDLLDDNNKAFDEILNFLKQNYTNAITSAANAETVNDKKTAWDDAVKAIKDKKKAWEDAVKAYKEEHNSTTESDLESASLDLYGMKTIEGNMILVQPTIDNLTQLLGSATSAETYFYSTLGDFAKCNAAEKAYKDAQLTTSAKTLQKSIEDAIAKINQDFADVDAAYKEAEESEEYVKVCKDIEDKTAEKENYSTANESALKAEIEKFSLKYFKVFLNDNATPLDPKDDYWDTKEIEFKDAKEGIATVPYDDEEFQADLKKAADSYDEKVKDAERDLKVAKDKYTAYKTARDAGKVEEFFAVEEKTYVKAVLDAQEEYDKAKKAADQAKADLDWYNKQYGIVAE